MNIQDLLKSGVDPQAFWNQLAQQAADTWKLSHCLFLQKSGKAEVRLFGQSAGSSINNVPSKMKALIVAGCDDPVQLDDDKGSSWLCIPSPDGEGNSVMLVAQSGSPLLPNELEQISHIISSAMVAFNAQRSADSAEKSLAEISKVVDLGLIIGEAHHFGEGAMRLCNEIATQLSAMRVTLGWQKKGMIQLEATNHGGRTRNDTELAGALCRAMDEAAEQNAEIAEPALEGATINKQHRTFSEGHGNCRIVSMPLRIKDTVHGVLSIENGSEKDPINQEQIDALRVVLDLVTPQLATLHEKSGWIGARIWRGVRKRAASLLGYKHTGWKLAGVVSLLLFLLACVIPMTHKVKAPFVLRTEASAELTAPFSGYIDKVYFGVGDIVKKGDVLAELDRRELIMQQTELTAERDRSLSDVRRYEAEGELSQMRLAQLAIEQADAKLEVLSYRLARTQIRAPFDGIIVEGDLQERLSSPAQVGESLMRIVQITDTFGELQVDERDIHFLDKGKIGEFAFTSRPDEHFKVKLDSYEPVAVIKESGTYFRVRASITDVPADWWRPGMSGVCKVDVGKRSVAWVYLHRSWEFVRLKLWF